MKNISMRNTWRMPPPNPSTSFPPRSQFSTTSPSHPIVPPYPPPPLPHSPSVGWSHPNAYSTAGNQYAPPPPPPVAYPSPSPIIPYQPWNSNSSPVIIDNNDNSSNNNNTISWNSSQGSYLPTLDKPQRWMDSNVNTVSSEGNHPAKLLSNLSSHETKRPITHQNSERYDFMSSYDTVERTPKEQIPNSSNSSAGKLKHSDDLQRSRDKHERCMSEDLWRDSPLHSDRKKGRNYSQEDSWHDRNRRRWKSKHHHDHPRKKSRRSPSSLRRDMKSHRRCSRSPHRSMKRESHKESHSKKHYSEDEYDDYKRKRYESDWKRSSSGSNYYDDPPSTSDQQILNKELEEEITIWTRCSPADLYYQRSLTNPRIMKATSKLNTLHEKFDYELIQRSARVKANKPSFDEVPRRPVLHYARTVSNFNEDTSEEEQSSEDEDNAVEELERKRKHPDRLHEELWYNDSGEMNDGPLCRCSAKSRRSGIRHGIYPGEEHLEPCDPNTNNAHRLFHYRITMSPPTNFLTKNPTVIKHDGHEFIFEGFSLFSHYKLDKLPTCKVIRFNIEYTILYIEEKLPENFTVQCLELFSKYLFREILELVDLDFKAHGDVNGCNRFHLMPRFVRSLEDNGKEILSMNNVLLYLLNSCRLLVEETELVNLLKMNQYEWQNFADEVKGMIATYPGMKPCSIRVDQLDRDQINSEVINYPEIVHFGIRPLQLSYAGNPSYQKAWREYVKFRHLLANKPKVSLHDRLKLAQKEMRLQDMRTKSNLKRDVTVVVSSQGFYRTGIMCDVVQHAMLIPVLVCHLRFHKSLNILEECINHKFKERYLLQLALTHPSYRENFGTNPDHARNSLTNCGIRQPEYGDRRIHYINTRKRGINTLINIMSRFGKREETISKINHNERLEFLGDAVVEFLTSIHLYHLFPDIEEGGLATYRAAIVQNQHLAVLAKNLELEKYMLYAHGSDLCHDLELRHAMANCLEALMGALFLDGGIEVADAIFSQTLFSDETLYDIWVNYPDHPLQEQEPDGDRKYIDSVPILQKLIKFEQSIGVDFKHIRLLARAFTHRSVGFNHLTLGSNQRLEFLGDTVLQLVASEYLYKHFPEHHEGHLSLLRSSLVNNRTQAVVCDDLGMVDYAIYAYPKGELKTKDRADLLEAFLGALYVDKGLEYCRTFCQVCFFPRLQDFIMNQDWNDPKSKLQQCCLTLRTMDGGEPDIPVYKVIECKGPTNTRIFTVAVYFRGERLATGSGHSIQQAEMAAASKALESSKELFPQLVHQQRVIERSLKKYETVDASSHSVSSR